MKKIISDKIKLEAISLVKNGNKQSDVAKKFGVTKTAISVWMKQANNPFFIKFASDQSLVDELRARGYDVKATKNVEL